MMDFNAKKVIAFVLAVVLFSGTLFGAWFLGVNYATPTELPEPPTGFSAQSVPTNPGAGSFVSKYYGGTFDNPVHIAVPTANATADIGLKIDNDSVAPALEVQDGGTPVARIDSAGKATFLTEFEVQKSSTPVVDVDSNGDMSLTYFLNFAPGSQITATSYGITPTNSFHMLTAGAWVTPTRIITTSASAGDFVIFCNAAAVNINLPDGSNDVEGTGPTLNQYDCAGYIYDSTVRRWMQWGTSNN
jgi:hypothetical protein